LSPRFLHRPIRFFSLNALLLIAGWCWLPQVAMAHAVLQTSTPAANATIDHVTNTLPILLTFNSRIDAAHSSLSLMAPDGKPTPLVIDTRADANVLRSQVSGIQPGRYSLRWQVVAGDGHITRGAIPFNVR
jgi:methionine-rich copper-binding protein CopC